MRCARAQTALCRLVALMSGLLAACLVTSMLWTPLLRIRGSSMDPALRNGSIVLSIRSAQLPRGAVVACSSGGRILVKRIVGCPGEQIDIDPDGTVLIDGQPLLEPYLTEHARGNCTTAFPCRVPEGQYFLMGDHRSVSVDSRNAGIGCVPAEQVLGRVVFCLWPPDRFGALDGLHPAIAPVQKPRTVSFPAADNGAHRLRPACDARYIRHKTARR